MGKKRSNIEILVDILKAAKYGAKKSHIVYKANLNFEIIKDYLDLLQNSGMITGPEGRNKIFCTTEKGVKYLDHFEAFKNYTQF